MENKERILIQNVMKDLGDRQKKIDEIRKRAFQEEKEINDRYKGKIIGVLNHLILNFDKVNGPDIILNHIDFQDYVEEYWEDIGMVVDKRFTETDVYFDGFDIEGDHVMVRLDTYRAAEEYKESLPLDAFHLSELVDMTNLLINIPVFKKVLTEYNMDILKIVNEDYVPFEKPIELDKNFSELKNKFELEDYIIDFLITSGIQFRKDREKNACTFTIMMDGKNLPFKIWAYYEDYHMIPDTHRLRVIFGSSTTDPSILKPVQSFYLKNLKELVELISEKIPKVISTDVMKQVNEELELDRIFNSFDWEELDEYLSDFLTTNGIKFRNITRRNSTLFTLTIDDKDTPFQIRTYRSGSLTAIIGSPLTTIMGDRLEDGMKQAYYPTNLKEMIELISEKIPKIVSFDVMKQVNESEGFQVTNMIKDLGTRIDKIKDMKEKRIRFENETLEKYRPILENFLKQIILICHEKYDMSVEEVLNDWDEDYVWNGDVDMDSIHIRYEDYADNVNFDTIYIKDNNLITKVQFGHSNDDWDGYLNMSDLTLSDMINIVDFLLEIPKIKTALTFDVLKTINESLDTIDTGNVGKIIKGLDIKIQDYNDFLTKTHKALRDIKDEYKPMLLNMLKQIVIGVEKEYGEPLYVIFEEEIGEDYWQEMYMNDSNLDGANYMQFMSMIIKNGELHVEVHEGDEHDSWNDNWDAKYLEMDDLMMIINFCLDIPKIKSALTIDALKIINESDHTRHHTRHHTRLRNFKDYFKR